MVKQRGCRRCQENNENTFIRGSGKTWRNGNNHVSRTSGTVSPHAFRAASVQRHTVAACSPLATLTDASAAQRTDDSSNTHPIDAIAATDDVSSRRDDGMPPSGGGDGGGPPSLPPPSATRPAAPAGNVHRGWGRADRDSRTAPAKGDRPRRAAGGGRPPETAAGVAQTPPPAVAAAGAKAMWGDERAHMVERGSVGGTMGCEEGKRQREEGGQWGG